MERGRSKIKANIQVGLGFNPSERSSSLDREALKKKFWKSRIHCILSYKGKAVYSTDFWPTLFGSTDLEIVAIRGEWKGTLPRVSFFFKSKRELRINSAQVSLSLDGNIWFSIKRSFPQIWLMPNDGFELRVPLERIGNGR